MKKSIQRSSIFSTCSKVGRVVSMMIMLLASTQVYSQIDCNTTMACNDLVQVSLDGTCMAVIAPDMMLEDPTYGNSDYTVIIRMPDGSIIPDATVNVNHIGMTLETQVVLTVCGNSCWGNITVEDKLPPEITSCDDYEVDCDDDITPGAGVVPRPTVSEACGTVEDFSYNDQVTNLPCSAMFAQTIVRTWTVMDNAGNEDNCTQTINVRRADIATITFPPNYDDIQEDAFSCGDILELLPNGAPSPNVTGRPEGTSCPNIQMFYDDIIFETCGASKKILRQWLVLDWCTGMERTENQTIKILDEIAPFCTTPPDFMESIPTDPGLCTGTYNVPAPIVTFECSDYDYTVSYKLRDENGNPFLNAITENVTRNPDGTYTISGLPQDTSWIIYTLTDACGNQSQCFSEVLIEDGEAPTPVCEGYTVISLEDQGWADLFATSIDDGSYDNCEIDRFEVKRVSSPCGFSSDLQFGEKVNFCCEDVSDGPVMVYMRVYDIFGNYNDCIVNVTVQDKINPIITCPPAITLGCQDDYTDLALTGTAVATDNCSVIVTHVDNEQLNDCGFGTVRRTWTATDPQGRKDDCVQIITIGDNTPFNGNDIGWPADRDITGCDASSTSPEALNSFPTTTNDDCAHIGMSYDDDVFYNVPDVCIKILRHWKISDHCNFDPQNPVYYEYTQKISVTNSQAPEITSDCNDFVIDANDGSCEATISETITATDDCTPGALLKYSYTLDYNDNGTIDESANGKTINGTYPGGTHRITWTVVDACDNATSCDYTFTIRDDKAPTPICLGEVIWVLDENGDAEVWASDFNIKSEDSCDEEDELTFSFNQAGNQQVLAFTCADVPNGIAATIELEMWVIDTDGNSEFCSVKLLLQDSQVTDACDDQDGARGIIAGMITTKNAAGVNDINVELVDMDDQESDSDMTQTGEYGFDNIDFYNEYIVSPEKNDDVKNGVNTLDLVKIQRHVLGLEVLDDPYTLIAADVNNDERITPADLLSLRKVILGLTPEFPSNNSWRFVPVTHEFVDETDPFGFPEEIVVSEFYNNLESADFTAVKVGDVDNSVVVDNSGLVSNEGNTAIAAIAPEFEAGEIFTVDFRANELKELVGMQMTLDFDIDALAYSTIKSGVLEMTDVNMGMSQQGKLAISWNDVNAINLNSDDVLFTVTFKSKASGSLSDYLSMGSSITDAQSYDREFNTTNLTLDITDNTGDVIEVTENKLYQNVPNPFNGSTTVRFDIAKGGVASLRVYDIAGKVISTQSGTFEAGQNEFNIQFEGQETINGVLYYTLETVDYQATRKMVVIR